MKASVSEPSRSEAGISAIFAIIVVTALMIMTVSLNEVIVRNIQRVGETEASLQAQSAANSAFEEALVYISKNCEVGCEVLDGVGVLQDVDDAEIATYEYEIYGLARQNPDEADDYYVPIPGRGDAGENCDPDAPGDADDACNWNRIYYGDTVEIPLYVDGSDTFDGVEFELKVRTADGSLLLCADGTATDTRNGCAFDDDLVVMTWQIVGGRDSGSDYLEGWEATNRFSEKREDFDSEIYTTHINSLLASDYVVVDIEDIYAPFSDEETIFEALTDGADPMVEPVLRLSFVQTISNNNGIIPYLEYQVVTDEPISSDRSFISVIGYTESQGETFFWAKEGSWTQFSSSPINFVFQN